MLASLLPGLRELRGPLIAGFLWLVALWLWIDLPARMEVETQGGARAELVELADAIGRPGMIAIVTVGAYFIGSLSEEARRWLIANGPWVRWRAATLARRRGRFRTIGSRRGEASMMEYLGSALAALAARAHEKGYPDVRVALGLPTEHRVADGIHVGDWEALMPEVTDELFREHGLLRTRLLVTEPLLAAEAERFDAEGHLRWSVVLPGAAILVTLAFQDHWVWLVGMLPIATLAVQGQRRLNDGADVVADALLAEVITAPSVDRLAAKIKAAPQQETSRSDRA